MQTSLWPFSSRRTFVFDLFARSHLLGAGFWTNPRDPDRHEDAGSGVHLAQLRVDHAHPTFGGMMPLKTLASKCALSSLAVAGLIGLAGTPAQAQTAAAADPAGATAQADANAKSSPTGFFGSFELGGLVDGYYDYYSTKPDGDATYQNFDTRHNAPRFSMGQVWLTKTPTGDSRAGMNVKFNFGHAATMINAAEPSTVSALKYIEQAYASYLLPVGK